MTTAASYLDSSTRELFLAVFKRQPTEADAHELAQHLNAGCSSIGAVRRYAADHREQDRLR